MCIRDSTYCYTVTSVYDEGESGNATDEACATPEPGIAPSDLFASVETDIIMLNWQAAGNNGGGAVVDYNIYRNGSLLDTAAGTDYSDDTAEHDVEYCYVVTANFPSGESLPTNESCAMWVLAAPMSITATGGNGFIEVEWTEPGVNTCANEVIPSLPFNTYGSNIGETNDWLVQGSEGADYAYLLVVTNPITIDVTLCSMDTDYDTKLEIFTADPDCNETTTGNYIDDDYTNCPDYVAPYPPSGLWGVYLNPGEYYIVVDLSLIHI